MKEKFSEYLKSIGITEAILKRIEKIYNFYNDIRPNEIEDIFITDYLDENGSRNYENIWFFSSKHCMEAKLFITKDNFDMDSIKNITYWVIEKENYDFKKATERSRISLTFQLSWNRSGKLKASKENCDYLKEIFLKYVLPNIKD